MGAVREFLTQEFTAGDCRKQVVEMSEGQFRKRMQRLVTTLYQKQKQL